LQIPWTRWNEELTTSRGECRFWTFFGAYKCSIPLNQKQNDYDDDYDNDYDDNNKNKIIIIISSLDKKPSHNNSIRKNSEIRI
jgi:hypothetical protein